MKVYEESIQDRAGLYADNAPSPESLYKDFVNVNISRLHESLPYICEVVYTLDRMLLDLYQHLRLLDRAIDQNQPDAVAQRLAAQQDAQDLLTIVRYILDGPINAIQRGIEKKMESENHGNVDDQHLQQTLDDQLKLLADAMLLSILRLQDGERFLRTLTTLSEEWKATKKGSVVAKVPLLGPMELLLRIIARNCTNLENFRQTARGLLVCNVVSGRILMPACVFACPGPHPAPPTGSLFVVTTSRESWWWYRRMNTWTNTARNRRAEIPPISTWIGNFDVHTVTAQLKPAMENENIWDYTNQQTPEGHAFSEAERLTRRKQFLANWRQDPAKRALHLEESVLDVSCPEFLDKARCIRCMHLFAYNVSHACLAAEDDQIKPPKINNNNLFAGWACAETIAHYYCVDAKHV